MATISRKPFSVVTDQQLNKKSNRGFDKKAVGTKKAAKKELLVKKASPKKANASFVVQKVVEVPNLDVPSRNLYSIEELMQLKPKICVAPRGIENWPDEVRFGFVKPNGKKLHTAKKDFLAVEKSRSKRSPKGCTTTEASPPSPTKSNIIAKPFPMLPVLPVTLFKTSPKEEIPVVSSLPVATISSLPSQALPTLNMQKLKGEDDPRRLEQRQKQIDLGKKTVSYYFYCKKVGKYERKRGIHPITPRKAQICSKRSWDGQVRKWRRMLHEYDPKTPEEIEEAFKLNADETSFLVSQRSGLTNMMEYYDLM